MMPTTQRHGDLSVLVGDWFAALGRRLWRDGRKDHVAMSVAHKLDRDDYGRARSALEQLRALNPNWDEGRAPSISKTAIDRALTLIGVFQRDKSVPAPRVGPMSDGGVELAWSIATTRGRLEIEARFAAEGDTLLVGLAHTPGFSFEGPINGGPDEFAQRIRDAFKDLSG
jgi:hypothetical protein